MMTTVKILAAVFAGFLLAACQATGTHYLGALADGEGGTITISGASTQKQSWEDLYLMIDSELITVDGQQLLSGTVEFSHHSQGMYGQVRSLDLRVFLVDEESRVVDYHTVMRFLGRSTRDKVPFRVVLPDAPQAVAYTFGYEATFSEKKDSVSTWNLPSRQR